MKFQSEYAENADELLQLKKRAEIPAQQKRKRLKIVRDFTNMINTMTEAEAAELGISEITNHGQTHRNMMQNQSQYESMVNGTNALLDLVVDTDNPEVDSMLSQRINEAINRGAIHHKGKFSRFWAGVGGEGVIAGGGAVTQNEKYGWLPKLRCDMFFPPECSLDPDEITYAFDPKELTLKDLENLLESIQDDEGVYIDKRALKDLIKRVKEKTKGTGVTEIIRRDEISRSTRDGVRSKDAIPAWWYYEIKFDDDTGEQYVSSTLFVDANACVVPKDGSGSAYIIAYYDKAFESPVDWLHYYFVDSEIGGVKNMDTVKGVAEMQYNSAMDQEELLNLIIEGEKIRARPMFKVNDQGDADKLAKWDARRSMYAPTGVEEMQLRGNSNGLQLPLALLSQTSSGISNTSSQGNSGQLRVEALANQQQTAIQTNNKITDAYNHLDAILEMVVWRLLAGPVKKGTEGYQETMWVRKYLDKYDIDYKELSKREYGRFVYLRVRARRVIGNGDRQQQIETADWLMANIQNYSPQVRPFLINKATALHTQDPDLADYLSSVQTQIINAQKITAENEADTIRRRAPLGQLLPTNADDIHQDHIPIHMLDMQALLSRNALRPWDKLDLLEFAGLVMHTQEHIRILMENPVTNGEAKGYMQEFQNIAAEAAAVVKEVQDREGTEQNQLTPKEQADLQIQWAKIELQARQMGMKASDMQELYKDREARNMLSRRSQYVKEINEDKRLKIEEKKINEQNTSTAGTN